MDIYGRLGLEWEKTKVKRLEIEKLCAVQNVNKREGNRRKKNNRKSANLIQIFLDIVNMNDNNVKRF